MELSLVNIYGIVERLAAHVYIEHTYKTSPVGDPIDKLLHFPIYNTGIVTSLEVIFENGHVIKANTTIRNVQDTYSDLRLHYKDCNDICACQLSRIPPSTTIRLKISIVCELSAYSNDTICLAIPLCLSQNYNLNVPVSLSLHTNMSLENRGVIKNIISPSFEVRLHEDLTYIAEGTTSMCSDVLILLIHLSVPLILALNGIFVDKSSATSKSIIAMSSVLELDANFDEEHNILILIDPTSLPKDIALFAMYYALEYMRNIRLCSFNIALLSRNPLKFAENTITLTDNTIDSALKWIRSDDFGESFDTRTANSISKTIRDMKILALNNCTNQIQNILFISQFDRHKYFKFLYDIYDYTDSYRFFPISFNNLPEYFIMTQIANTSFGHSDFVFKSDNMDIEQYKQATKTVIIRQIDRIKHHDISRVDIDWGDFPVSSMTLAYNSRCHGALFSGDIFTSYAELDSLLLPEHQTHIILSGANFKTNIVLYHPGILHNLQNAGTIGYCWVYHMFQRIDADIDILLSTKLSKEILDIAKGRLIDLGQNLALLFGVAYANTSLEARETIAQEGVVTIVFITDMGIVTSPVRYDRDYLQGLSWVKSTETNLILNLIGELKLMPGSQKDESNANSEDRQSDSQVNTTSVPTLTMTPEERNEILRQFNSPLNKLSKSNYYKLANHLREYKNKIIDVEIIKEIVGLIFEKALHAIKYIQLFADLCIDLSNEYPPVVSNGKKATFRKVMIAHCQEEFNRINTADIINVTDDEIYFRKKSRMTAYIEFIAALASRKFVYPTIIHYILKTLMWSPNENIPKMHELELATKFLSSVGPHVHDSLDIEIYITRSKELIKNSLVETRIRYLLTDIIELRENNWISRNQTTSRKIGQHTPQNKLSKSDGSKRAKKKKFYAPRLTKNYSSISPVRETKYSHSVSSSPITMTKYSHSVSSSPVIENKYKRSGSSFQVRENKYKRSGSSSPVRETNSQRSSASPTLTPESEYKVTSTIINTNSNIEIVIDEYFETGILDIDSGSADEFYKKLLIESATKGMSAKTSDVPIYCEFVGDLIKSKELPRESIIHIIEEILTQFDDLRIDYPLSIDFVPKMILLLATSARINLDDISNLCRNILVNEIAEKIIVKFSSAPSS